VNRLPKLSLRGRSAPEAAPALSATAQRQISQILSAQPEAAEWLAIIEAVLREVQAPAWDEAAGATLLASERAPHAPLLAGARVPVDRSHAADWLALPIMLASNAGADAAPLVQAAHSPFLNAVGLLEAAINADDDRIEMMARELGVPAASLGAVAELAAIPLHQALRRRLSGAVDHPWHAGFCPICGDWPRLAELRGLERARRLRCARCGGDWEQPGVRCPFCDATGQGTRATLISDQDGEARKVETCTRCRGYLKVVSTLRAWPGDEVSLADLATIDLDLVALERDYERPEPRGGLDVRLG